MIITRASFGRTSSRFRFVSSALGALLLVGACSDDDITPELDFGTPETAVAYDVDLSGVTNDEARELIYEALELYRRQEDGAQSVAFLRRRAQGDVATVQKILRSFGYFEAEVAIDVDTEEELAREREEIARRIERGELTTDDILSGAAVQPAPGEGDAASTPTAAAPAAASTTETTATVAAETDDGEEAAPLPRAVARVMVRENRRYILARHAFTLVETGAGDPPAQPDAALLGSPVGEPARADRILSAEKRAVSDLRDAGRPYARQIDRDAVADPAIASIEVETTIDAGDQYVYGDVTYSGNETVDTAYLDTYRPFEKGEVVDPQALIDFQRKLIETNLFDAGSVTFPDEPPAGGVAPVTVALEEGPKRTISGGVRYDTFTGPAVRGRFQNRNLFGANETLMLDALVGLQEQALDTRYRIPQWHRSGQDLVFGFEARRLRVDAFNELGATLAGGIEREVTPELTIGYGGLLEVSQLEDDNGTRVSKLAGLPTFVAYDSTDDLLDPSKGFRANLSATPFGGFIDSTPAAFGIVDGTVSTYYDLTGDKTYIAAARGRLGSAIAGSLDIVAANRRLYSGGGGSVRGYGERLIGPLDDNDDPTGGLSVAELGLELRAKLTETIGAAAFVEAGSVSTDVVPTFSDGVQIGAGGGLRYFSPVGPIRFDVGVPVNPRDVDDLFQVYISIGQAF